MDADNQSAQCAGPLLALFRTEFNARIISATIAGNNLGQKIDDWRSALLAGGPTSRSMRYLRRTVRTARISHC